MLRLLFLSLILSLMISHGSLSALGHAQPVGPAQANSNDDQQYSRVAAGQETIGVYAGKNAPSPTSHGHSIMDGLLGEPLAEPLPPATRETILAYASTALRSLAVPPLLEPPLA